MSDGRNSTTDILVRLRHHAERLSASGAYLTAEIMGQAADEIDRLHTEISILENDLRWWRDGFEKKANHEQQ